MRTNITVLIDRSGSMQGPTLKDHIGGIKSFIKEQKKIDGAILSLIQFDNNGPYEISYDGVNINDVNEEDFTIIPRGGTPLLDALGSTLARIQDQEKKEKSDQVILMVLTDGAENASRDWTIAKIRTLLTENKDWVVLYLGSGIDSFADAQNFGLTYGKSMNFDNSNSSNVNFVYRTTSNKLAAARGRGVTSVDFDNAMSYTKDEYTACEVWADNSKAKTQVE